MTLLSFCRSRSVDHTHFVPKAPTTEEQDSDGSSDIDLDAPAMRVPAAAPTSQRLAKKPSVTLVGPGGGGEGSDVDLDDEADPAAATYNFQCTNAVVTEHSVGLRCTVRKIDSAGVIRWVGLHKQTGLPRILVELEKPLGQNDGSQGGHVYSPCKPRTVAWPCRPV